MRAKILCLVDKLAISHSFNMRIQFPMYNTYEGVEEEDKEVEEEDKEVEEEGRTDTRNATVVNHDNNNKNNNNNKNIINNDTYNNNNNKTITTTIT